MAQRRFDRWAPTYEASILQKVFFDPLHALVVEELAERPPKRLLDVGCGTGRLLRRAGERFPGLEAAGVDASAEMIAVASAKSPETRFEVGKAESLPFADCGFDAVCTTASMHHWSDPAAGLREIGRVLVPGGRLVIADIQLGGVYGWVMRLIPRAWHGERVFASDELVALLEGAGLNTVRQRVPGGYGRSVLITVAERA